MSSTAKSLASTRIASLLDENSFVELGGSVTARSTDFNIQQEAAPSDGVVTGYGVIDGNLVYVYSQDASVLGGTVGEMHARKIVNLYQMAMKMGAPVIGLIDCAGLRLQEATDALNAFGRIYKKQALASGVIPQITAVFGNCGGGLALIPGIIDFTSWRKRTQSSSLIPRMRWMPTGWNSMTRQVPLSRASRPALWTSRAAKRRSWRVSAS